MKRVVITLILVISLINNSTAQKRDIVEYKQNWDKQTVFWGYYLGVNKKDFKITYTTTNQFIDVTPSTGFEVGLIGDIRLHKNINLRLEPGLSSNTKTLTFTNIQGDKKDSIRKLNGTYIRIPLLLNLVLTG